LLSVASVGLLRIVTVVYVRYVQILILTYLLTYLQDTSVADRRTDVR